MSKNWLIRTKSNHILGPISKEKVLELLQNGSIKADDEVCSGNGFWFYIREDDMVARFLLGREQQTFNPISEAKDVLTFPQKGQQHDEDITLVGGINLKNLRGNTPPTGTYVAPLTDLKTPSSPEPKKKADVAPVKNENLEPRKPAQRVLKPKGPKPVLKKQNYLQYLAILCFIGLLALIWYRKTILKYFKADFSFTLIEEVYAQEQAPAEKKN